MWGLGVGAKLPVPVVDLYTTGLDSRSPPPAQHKKLKNREKIPGKGSAQPRAKIEPLALDPRGVTAMTVTPQRALVSVGGMAVTYGRYFLAVSEVIRFYL